MLVFQSYRSNNDIEKVSKKTKDLQQLSFLQNKI